MEKADKRKIVLIGTGMVGMSYAYALLNQNLCDELVLIDINKKRAEGEAMAKEMDRCRMAVDLAAEGKTVAMVSSGDSGIYGMAGILLEIANEKKADVEIETVPGVTAASAAASILGAPLMHDFTIISLSDLMTPYSLIMKRVDCAGQGDFIVCLYNPKSKTGTGFGFTDYNAEGFLDAILAALDVYRKNPEEWKNLTAKGMRKNYSWKASSRKYEKLYSDL